MAGFARYLPSLIAVMLAGGLLALGDRGLDGSQRPAPPPLAGSDPTARALGMLGDSDELVRLRARIAAALVAHEFREAAALCEALLAKHPTDVNAHLAWSDALLELGRLEEAESALDAALALKPCGPAYFRAGYLLHLRGASRAAVAAFDLALDATDPRDTASRAWVLGERGEALRADGRLDEAQRSFERALALNPRREEARLGLARVARSRGELEEAVDLLEQVRSATPEPDGELAQLYRALGREDRARLALARALALGERDDHYWRGLALVLADHGLEPERALALAGQELERRAGPHGLEALAWTLSAAGRHPEALEAVEGALALGTREPALLFRAGVIAWRAGDARWTGWLTEACRVDPWLRTRLAQVAPEVELPTHP